MQLRLINLVFVAVSAFIVTAIELRAETVEDAFQRWIHEDLRSLATEKGISGQTFELAFAGVKPKLDLPDLVVPGKTPQVPAKQTQAEFKSPAEYFSEKIIAPLVSGGTARAGQYAKTLQAIEKKYGVPQAIILAIWGRESGFGKSQGSYRLFDVLATKAFMSTRKELFLKETLAALEIVEKGYATPDMMKASWAGAMGQPQFLPSSYLDHAVDFDGDGRRDIWRSVPDTMASIANYLVHYGWEAGATWGTEVSVPENISCALEGPDQGKPLSAWLDAGVMPVEGQKLPTIQAEKERFLMAPAGRQGPLFLTTANFYVIKNYNMSDLYALFIGHVADRMANGGTKFKAQWHRFEPLKRSEIAALQNALVSKNYDVGKTDGLPGFKTRRSIGDWQIKNGMAATCFPSAALMQVLK